MSFSNWHDELRELVVGRAIANLGYGETTANNAGPFIEAIGGKQGMEWCALLAGHCYRRAYIMLEQEPPSWLFRRPGVAEPGALRLCTGLAAVGCKFTDPALALPGDLGLLSRKGGHHVFVVESVDDGMLVHTIAGNEGRFPSKVRRTIRDVERDPNFKWFATVRRSDEL